MGARQRRSRRSGDPSRRRPSRRASPRLHRQPRHPFQPPTPRPRSPWRSRQPPSRRQSRHPRRPRPSRFPRRHLPSSPPRPSWPRPTPCGRALRPMRKLAAEGRRPPRLRPLRSRQAGSSRPRCACASRIPTPRSPRVVRPRRWRRVRPGLAHSRRRLDRCRRRPFRRSPGRCRVARDPCRHNRSAPPPDRHRARFDRRSPSSHAPPTRPPGTCRRDNARRCPARRRRGLAPRARRHIGPARDRRDGHRPGVPADSARRASRSGANCRR